MAPKRKADATPTASTSKPPAKKQRVAEKKKPTPPPSEPEPKRRPTIIRLTPRRPAPRVPTSSSATGPYSARAEGKNIICVTRRLELGAYLRRCKALVQEDGYRKIHLYALGAAIPHALLLATSLPSTLPYAPDEIKTAINTGTVPCIDEVLPDEKDEEEDEGGMRIREKSCVDIVIAIGDGTRADPKRRKNGGPA